MDKFGRIVIFILIFIIVAIALVTGANILFFWSVFGFIEHLIRSVTGMESNLAKALAALSLSFIVILPMGKMLRSFSPFPQKNKKMYRALVFLAVSIFFIFAFIGRRELYFDPYSGNSIKYYSETNGCFTFFDSPGYDPITGDQLRPVTKEVVLRSKGLYEESSKPPNKMPVAKEPEKEIVQAEYVQELPTEAPTPSTDKEEYKEEEIEDSDDYERKLEKEVPIKSNKTYSCTIRNCLGEPLTMTNLATHEEYAVPAHISKEFMLEPGLYSASYDQQFYRVLEVADSDGQVFRFLSDKQILGPSTHFGMLVCDNTGPTIKLRVIDKSCFKEVMVLGPNKKDSILLPPGEYAIYGACEGIRFSDRINIEANKTYFHKSSK